MINKEKFTMTNEEDNLYDREDDLIKELTCCEKADCVLETEQNPSASRFTESYKCKNCKKTVVYYIKLERYERYDKNGNIEYERNLTT